MRRLELLRGAALAPVSLLRAADVHNLSRAVRAGELTRVMSGVYAPASPWSALTPWERYLARVHAAAIIHPDAVFVLESGAALCGLPVFGEPPDVHLLSPTPAKSRATLGVRIHTSERMPETIAVGGVHVATPAEVAVDIARSRHPAVGLAVASAALRADPTLSVSVMTALSASRATTRGVRAADWVFERASATAESTLESVSLAVIEWLGFPAPALQQWFGGHASEGGDRVDFWWEQWRIAGESDGDIKYSGAYGDARGALRQRNTRDARLRARGVRGMAHWSWTDAVTFAPLCSILLSAGLPQLRPAQLGPLRALASAMRGSARAACS